MYPKSKTGTKSSMKWPKRPSMKISHAKFEFGKHWVFDCQLSTKDHFWNFDQCQRLLNLCTGFGEKRGKNREDRRNLEKRITTPSPSLHVRFAIQYTLIGALKQRILLKGKVVKTQLSSYPSTLQTYSSNSIYAISTIECSERP